MSFFRDVSSPARARHAISASGTRAAPACTLVIFGAFGDLTKRLLMPALYNLAGQGLLDDKFRIIGIDRVESTTQAWHDGLTTTMDSFTTDRNAEFYTPEIDQTTWSWLLERMDYTHADFTDEAQLRDVGATLKGPAVFYLAVPSRFFATAVQTLGKAGLVDETDGFRRVVIEKPFGSDLATAEELNRTVLSVVSEEQVYRIDHFLGKETVQNILAMRFGNILFEPLWRSEYIDHIQITAAETIGVEGRGAFYEPTGALRDMVPNHLFQLFAMVAMEPPNSFSADTVRTAKEQLFEAVRPVRPEDAVRGQYTAGTVEGRKVIAYRAAEGVAPDSTTETYVALKLHVDNWRWSGVPFYLRTGKSLGGRRTEVVVQFRKPPLEMFARSGGETDAPGPNRIILNIQPEEGLTIEMAAKHPGPEMNMAPVAVKFRYGDAFQQQPNVGYETLLYDCLTGDATLFQRADNINAAWRAVDPVLTAWAADPSTLEWYAAGETGPKSADELLARDGRSWYPLERPEKPDPA
ncbi:glucose-6-phosphate 1-dehydrogenase [Ameyamaea chiangmaiensis NBRC 103196]|uniref:Glucose-6-phosphate 1-dehydrogenase n=1 Tax=Ameyamaea chiangmaiensis TaxID=442969 RepID=A0A850PAP0_9PROT|nr:glucose-6-phosphate dehydrogenase [Ameyamaea chiangmaiensis]MBS4075058.1 glucose-6-phosphate dehydrogenase [Ameyamaea chiangmaiensis]NVN41124.1 glucose-6-phosphate dehydrogenase [Ameyamaea chiangmaiensis]GBQ65619.1 glucose-6-phosphate 1-dehydrogenase [Ameyamaea chiangmaiensis NBRC 103196]